jgi:hypothetical protein
MSAFEVRFQLRGSSQLPTAGPHSSRHYGRLPRITQVLALAIHFEEIIARGDAKDYADIARLSCLSRERVSQIVRLVYLAPDIQVELLYLPPSSQRFPISETSVRKIASLLCWTDQRREWALLKARCELVHPDLADTHSATTNNADLSL